VLNKTPCPLTPAETTIGWDVSKLDEAFRFACELGTTTLIVATNGEVVRTMGDLAAPHRVHSVRKALLSALVGQHVGARPRQINLENTLAELGIDDEPVPLTGQQKEAKVLHLIKSVSGINRPAAAEGGLMQKDKDRRLGQTPNTPGTKWAYNNWDYNALTTIFVQETGLSVYAAFTEGIADPLGMQDFGKAAVALEYERGLSIHPKAGFTLSARDLLKFGQLCLNKGDWQGREIVPPSWIDRITQDYTLTGRAGLRSAHGYLWWVPVDEKSRLMGVPVGTYIATGFGSQRIVVIPAWNTVIVHQVDTRPFFKCCRELMSELGYGFKDAVTDIFVKCRYLGTLSGSFCRRCGWAFNFVEGESFVRIFEKILEARINR
jgi:CubicO group peptidase (beta-lactamase class C family)